MSVPSLQLLALANCPRPLQFRSCTLYNGLYSLVSGCVLPLLLFPWGVLPPLCFQASFPVFMRSVATSLFPGFFSCFHEECFHLSVSRLLFLFPGGVLPPPCFEAVCCPFSYFHEECCHLSISRLLFLFPWGVLLATSLFPGCVLPLLLFLRCVAPFPVFMWSVAPFPVSRWYAACPFSCFHKVSCRFSVSTRCVSLFPFFQAVCCPFLYHEVCCHSPSFQQYVATS